MDVMDAINSGKFLDAVSGILSGGGMVVSSFLLGGVILGTLFAPPSYFIFLYVFNTLFRGEEKERPVANE